MRVLIGNSAPKEAYRDGDGVLCHRPVDGARITTVHVPDTYTLLEQVAAVTAPDGVWNHHSQGDNVADSTPDWIQADDTTLTTVLANALGCPAGRPKAWNEDY